MKLVHIIKDIDKAQLGKKYDLKTLKDIENVRFLAVDEIAIHKHHNYATVFMNLENGHIVYCEQGKKKDQVIHILLICYGNNRSSRNFMARNMFS